MSSTNYEAFRDRMASIGILPPATVEELAKAQASHARHHRENQRADGVRKASLMAYAKGHEKRHASQVDS